MRYMKEIVKKNRIWVFVYIAIGIFNSFMTNFKADYFQKVVDGLASGTVLFSGILMYGAILLVDYIMNYVDEYPAKKLEHGMFLDFKLLALRKISCIDYLEYQRAGTGMMVQRIESGAAAGRNVLYHFWFCLIRQLIPTILFSIYFIFKMNRTVTCILLAGYGIVFIVTNALLKFLYQIKEKILDSEERLNHYLVRGFMEMLVFRMERQFPNEMKKASNAKEQIVSAKVKMNMIHEAFFTIFAILVAVLDVGILLFAWKTQSISVGAVVALLSLIENAYTPIAIFNVLYVQYKLDWTAFGRFEEVLLLKEDTMLQDGKYVSRVLGDIKVENLSFQYGDRRVLSDVNLSIKQGEKVAFVGESGSGKSTLAKLLVGLLKYDEGHIYLDGEELRNICLNGLYEKVSYLSQDSPVFDGTIRENLVFDRKVEEAELLDVLQKVNLRPLFEQLSNGWNTEIGERGTCLSGGEKQRLALARIWFDSPSIVVLDEATSAMDTLTEETVMRYLMSMLQGKTVISITHRFHSIAEFDKIVVFHKGKIVGVGAYDELINNNTYFADLYNRNLQS
ncbi:MAG: ABC transporter ATP-binding protein [bacterium]|nr:ABC transporter ATP-binding protein [bacterium]